MATAAMNGNTGNGKARKAKPGYASRIDLIRSTIRSLLNEPDLRTDTTEIDPSDGLNFYERVARYEAHLIESALERTGGRQNQAARLLGLRNSTLSWKIKRLAIRAK